MTSHKIIATLVAGIAIFCSIPHMWADRNPSDTADKSLAIDSITASWQEWETVALSGKFKMEGLPLSPSVKIFMVRDSAILISLRAPFVGEVGRAEIVDSTLLVVNKMNKTYVEEPISKALAYYPGGVSDIQDLLLGRVVVPGYGILNSGIAQMVEIYPEDDGTSTLIATKETAVPGFNYGYIITPGWLTGALMVLPVARPDVAVVLSYEYFEKGYDIDFMYQSDERSHRALLDLGLPDFGAKGFDSIKLGSGYTQLPFDKFIKSFK